MVEENNGECLRPFDNVTITLGGVYHSIGTFYITNVTSLGKAKYYFEKSRNILLASGRDAISDQIN